MSSLVATPYKQFIEVLWMLEVYTPYIPSEPDRIFVLFRSSGSGYVPTPTTPSYPFVSKDAETLVPAFEIFKALNGLEIPVEDFLVMLEKCSPKPLSTEPEQPPSNRLSKGC